MNLSEWTKYRDLLKNINEKAADTFRDAVWNVHGKWKGVGLGQIPRDELIDYAYALATKYGEASAAVSAEMFDKTAFIQQAAAFEAIPAETATYNEVAKTVNGVLKTSQNVNEMAGAISRLVKKAGCDTTIQNVNRYNKKYGKKKNTGAQFAWVPSGDTCPFCLMLASNGWVNQTVGGAKDHAEHVHSNCDCAYMVRFNDSFSIDGYDPDRYKEMFDTVEGDTWGEKVNAMRRKQYAQDKDRINAQKRAAYAERKGKIKEQSEFTNDDSRGIIKKKSGALEMNLQFFAEEDIKKQESNSLKRGINSYEKQIEKHQKYIANPEAYISDWDSKSENEKNGLIKHWNKEIRNFNNSIQDRIDELKRRGDYDE